MTPTRIQELRALLAASTPGPWTNEPGRFWICDIGNNSDDPGVWSTAIPTDGSSFPFGEKAADAAIIVSAVNELSGLLDENERLRECLRELVSAIDADRCGDDSIWDDLLNFGMGDGGPLTRARAALQQEKKG